MAPAGRGLIMFCGLYTTPSRARLKHGALWAFIINRVVNYLFFFACFNFRFSFGLRAAFFWFSFLPLFLLPPSPTLVSFSD